MATEAETSARSIELHALAIENGWLKWGPRAPESRTECCAGHWVTTLGQHKSLGFVELLAITKYLRDTGECVGWDCYQEWNDRQVDKAVVVEALRATAKMLVGDQ